MPRRKGAGEGKWKSKKTGKFVSSYYAKRNPANVERVEDSVTDAKRDKMEREDEKKRIQEWLWEIEELKREAIHLSWDIVAKESRMFDIRLRIGECAQAIREGRAKGG